MSLYTSPIVQYDPFHEQWSPLALGEDDPSAAPRPGSIFWTQPAVLLIVGLILGVGLTYLVSSLRTEEEMRPNNDSGRRRRRRRRRRRE